MSLLQRDREIILTNPYVDNFDFNEIEHFVKNASKELFISYKFKNNPNKTLVQPRGGFPLFKKCMHFMSSLK